MTLPSPFGPGEEVELRKAQRGLTSEAHQNLWIYINWSGSTFSLSALAKAKEEGSSLVCTVHPAQSTAGGEGGQAGMRTLFMGSCNLSLLPKS